MKVGFFVKHCFPFYLFLFSIIGLNAQGHRNPRQDTWRPISYQQAMLPIFMPSAAMSAPTQVWSQNTDQNTSPSEIQQMKTYGQNGGRVKPIPPPPPPPPRHWKNYETKNNVGTPPPQKTHYSAPQHPNHRYEPSNTLQVNSFIPMPDDSLSSAASVSVGKVPSPTVTTIQNPQSHHPQQQQQINQVLPMTLPMSGYSRGKPPPPPEFKPSQWRKKKINHVGKFFSGKNKLNYPRPNTVLYLGRHPIRLLQHSPVKSTGPRRRPNKMKMRRVPVRYHH